MKILKICLYLGAILIFSACNLQREVDLDLPEYEPQIVVESYLEPGNPYILTLLESSDYYGDVRLNYLRDADVTITHNGRVDTLVPFELEINSSFPPGFVDTALLNLLEPIIGDAIYLYTSLLPVPPNYDQPFQLNITTADGRKVDASTIIPAPITFDTLEWRFNDDSLAIFLTKFQDDPDQSNYYRRLLERVVIDTVINEMDTTISSRTRTEQDFTIDDEVSNGEQLTFGSNFEYRRGDTLIATMFHITEDYYEFTFTRDAAITASFSPFAPPTVVTTNINGGVGIFTGFARTSQTIVIE